MQRAAVLVGAHCPLPRTRGGGSVGACTARYRLQRAAALPLPPVPPSVGRMRALRPEEWAWLDRGATVEISVQLPRQVAGRAAPDDGIAASAKISPRRFTLSLSDAVSGDEASLHVEGLLNVVDPRASTTRVNQSARTVTVSLAKWGREKLPWPTLVQEPAAFENDPRSPYQNVLAQETAPPPDQLLEGLWLGGIGNLPRGRRWFADNEITHTLSVCDYWPVRDSA